MKQADSIVEAQLQHMLELIDEFRQDQSSSILNEAGKQARAVVKQAYADGRAQLHHNVMKDRNRVREAITSAQAQRDTHIRQQQQQADKSSLQKAWILLENQLIQSWSQTRAQNQWLEMTLNQAANMLPHGNWTIYHPTTWTTAQSNFDQQIEQHISHKPVFKSDSAIKVGIRICHDSACVDATLEGLLHDRSRIESMLLAVIHQLRNGESL